MPRKAAGLTAAEVKTKGPGRYADGGGLYLFVKDNGSRFWTFRYQRDGVSHEIGLGTAGGVHPIKLAAARTAAYRLLDTLRAGGDPAADKAEAKAKRKAEAAPKALAVVTFQQVAEYFITSREKSWKNAIHRAQWGSSLKTYVYPVIGSLAVGEIDTGHISSILEPLWETKNETASRLRGRIENILDYAKTKGWRPDTPNPARWKGHLAHTLARPEKVRAVVHHPSMPWKSIGDFMVQLRTKTAISAKALEFVILTAARSGEVRMATWDEIDLKEKIWTVPAARMKMGKEHRVPLSAAALAILNDMKAANGSAKGTLVFPGGKKERPLSDVAVAKMVGSAGGGDAVPHGFRSTFRTWAAEATAFPREIAEQALAHGIKGVEGDYQRGDLLEKRRKLMDAWAGYCGKPSKKVENNVVSLTPQAA
jgi:integrase